MMQHLSKEKKEVINFSELFESKKVKCFKPEF